MYIPRRFEEKDTEKIHSFIRENSFGILVSVKDGVPAGTHIPLLLEKDEDGRDILMGHISRGNEQKYTLTDGARVLVIFPGPHAYVSPRWYTQLTVPTWNYISVHVYGTVKIVEGDALHAALRRLMDHYEHPMPHPVAVEEVPEKTYDDNFRGIVGFKIFIDEIQAAYKLSQNRDEESYHRIVQELGKGDDVARGVAEEMKKRSTFGS
jgi:transcriptional regulator